MYGGHKIMIYAVLSNDSLGRETDSFGNTSDRG